MLVKKTFFISILSLLVFSVSCQWQNQSSDKTTEDGGSSGWISSGGDIEMLNNRHNSWWVTRSTKTVNYCIQYQSDEISASREQVGLAIQAAIDFWQTKDLNLSSEEAEVSYKGIEFQLTDCAKNPELQFKFGWNSLDKNEQEFLKKEKLKTAAKTIRKTYDPKLLKARGTVYLGSDIGPNRFDYVMPETPRWQFGFILLTTLMHEMGHVFGYPHTDHAFLMQTKFVDFIFEPMVVEAMMENPNNLVDANLSEALKHAFSFKPVKYYSLCDPERLAELIKIFKIQTTFAETCAIIEFEEYENVLEFSGYKIYFINAENINNFDYESSIKLDGRITSRYTHFYNEAISTLYIDKQQSYFQISEDETGLNTYFGNTLLVDTVLNIRTNTIFVKSDSEKFYFNFVIEPQTLNISFYSNDEIMRFDFEAASKIQVLTKQLKRKK